jgi:hypothetical protein
MKTTSASMFQHSPWNGRTTEDDATKSNNWQAKLTEA